MSVLAIWMALAGCSYWNPETQIFCSDVCAVDAGVFARAGDEGVDTSDTAGLEVGYDECVETCQADNGISQDLLSCMGDGDGGVVVTDERLAACEMHLD